jgi:hypothetical protein
LIGVDHHDFSGMPYSQWKENHQLAATEEQMAKFTALNKK